MKKIIAILLICFAANTSIKAQYVNIPDANFRIFLESKYPSCFNAAHEMDTTCSAVVNETDLDCSVLNIASLDGIQYFDGLLSLNCSGNLLTSIPKLPSVMNSLNCSNNLNLSCISRIPNAATSGGFHLNTSNTGIQCLPNYCNNLVFVSSPFIIPVCNASNNPNSCDVYPNNYAVISTQFGNYLSTKITGCLIKLQGTFGDTYLLDTTCSGVLNMDTLIISGFSLVDFNGLQYLKNLKYLDCSLNDFASIPNLPSQLEYLNCSGCGNLLSLPSLPANLKYLDSRDAGLQSLPILPNSLQYLNVHSNPLISLPTLPSSLKFLDCSAFILNAITNKFITSLPILPTSLDSLNIFNQKIVSLPTLPSSLVYLECGADSQLTCLPYLPSSLKFLGIQTTHIVCLPNNVIMTKARENFVFRMIVRADAKTTRSYCLGSTSSVL